VASALLGAIVGGVFTVVGAVHVMRRERERIHRERLYETLLPRLIDHLDTNGLPYVREDAAAMLRVARLAGGKDVGEAVRVSVAAVAALDAYNLWEQDRTQAPRYEPAFEDARKLASTYMAHLADEF
jgi:hypothetical protein